VPWLPADALLLLLPFKGTNCVSLIFVPLFNYDEIDFHNLQLFSHTIMHYVLPCLCQPQIPPTGMLKRKNVLM
jgi:hypothetical protein